MNFPATLSAITAERADVLPSEAMSGAPQQSRGSMSPRAILLTVC